MHNKKIFSWSISVALAGFLFGFDTVVISGANLPIKELWNTSPSFHGIFIMSMALWGTVIGSIFGSIPCDKIGRKSTLFWIGILFFISAVGSALAMDPYFFSFFRFIGGVGVGASTVASPTYISEISNKDNRGKLVALYQFNIVLGILIAYFSNFLLKDFGGDLDWRYMLGIEAIPAFFYILSILSVPKSPRWLILFRDDIGSARKILSQIYDEKEVENKILKIKNSIINKKSEKLFSGTFNYQIKLAFLLSFFNQLSGINFVLYYAPEILQTAGFGTSDSLMSSISIGFINLIFTLVGLRLIDSYGRRNLMFIGSIGYIISLFTIGICFVYQLDSFILLFFILVFVASHAIGQGTVIWVFLSEIFPNHMRASGQSFGTAVHWIFAALITASTPIVINLLGNNPGMVFYLFAIMMIFQLLFVVKMMPETKGISLDKMNF
jgi:SP family xylose:H+ symportor-like MFS transporter|tara:strand:- start:554 stop:1870 length:1317 start_codon:yes stop_codon:yes gene_type:complete